jgi:hypothetical protein
MFFLGKFSNCGEKQKINANYPKPFWQKTQMSPYCEKMKPHFTIIRQ